MSECIIFKATLRVSNCKKKIGIIFKPNDAGAMFMVLDKVTQRPNDVKELKEQELPILADEIRQFIIDKVSAATGGSSASNLGVVELTIALHRCFKSTGGHIGMYTSIIHNTKS